MTTQSRCLTSQEQTSARNSRLTWRRSLLRVDDVDDVDVLYDCLAVDDGDLRRSLDNDNSHS